MGRVRTGNRQLIRELNTNLVLNTIRQSSPVCQAEIMRGTRLSAGTVTSIVKELKDRDLVCEIGPGQSSIGRKPRLLEFNAEARVVISAAFFADETHVGILDLDGNLKKQVEFTTRPRSGPEVLFSNFCRQAGCLLADTGIPRDKLLGVGVGFEGIVDHDSGKLLLSTRFGWRDVEVKDEIERRFGTRTVVNHEGAAMALGEYRYGAGQAHEDMVCIDVDAGIGSVEISHGRIRAGRHNMAGEIGHTLVVQGGQICKCGKRGCLETVASGWAIVSTVRDGIRGGIKSTVSDEVHSASVRVATRAVFRAAREGDDLALTVIRDAGRYLGLAIAAVVNYVDPELIVLTGCVADQSDGMLLQLAREYAMPHVVDSRAGAVEIEQGVLGQDAVLIGAATFVYEEAFKLPVSY